MRKQPKVVTVVLELTNTTLDELMAVYRNSIYIEGARVLSITDGDVSESLANSESDYDNLLNQDYINSGSY